MSILLQFFGKSDPIQKCKQTKLVISLRNKEILYYNFLQVDFYKSNQIISKKDDLVST
jgi:hypothetical protein